MRAWTAKTEKRMRDVMRESTQDVVDMSQEPVAKGGKMPVDTGNLRNSFLSGLNGSFSFSVRTPDPSAAAATVAAQLVIAKMDFGDIANFGWSAEYAQSVHNGPAGRAGYFWVDHAVQGWQGIVDKNIARAKIKYR